MTDEGFIMGDFGAELNSTLTLVSNRKTQMVLDTLFKLCWISTLMQPTTFITWLSECWQPDIV